MTRKIIGSGHEKIIGELANARSNQLVRIEQQAIKFIKSVAAKNDNIHVAYSGGKDSEVLLYLVRKSGIKYTAFYNATTIDPPGTINWIRQHTDVQIIQPRYTFYQLIEHRGLPTFARRFCCAFLKERYTAETVLAGIRRLESQRRSQLYAEPEVCKLYDHDKRTRQYYPIFYWTDKQIAAYIEFRHIQCHHDYYDRNKQFHVERRLGCLGCPLPAHRSIDDFRKYPNLARAWCRALAVYRNTRPKLTNSVAYFADEYQNLQCNLFFKTYQDFAEYRHRHPNYNAKDELESLLGVTLPEPRARLTDICQKLGVTCPSF